MKSITQGVLWHTSIGLAYGAQNIAIHLLGDAGYLDAMLDKPLGKFMFSFSVLPTVIY